MNLRLLLMILTSVFLSAGAQVLFKFGMRRVDGARPEVVDAGTAQNALLAALMTPSVLAGFVFYGGSALLWLFVLERTDVSVAYPFVGVGFIVTMLAGWLLFGENLTLVRLLGTVLVCVGVALIAVSTK